MIKIKLLSPCLCLGSKYEDLKEKYNKEVEERKRLEAEVKAWQAKVSQVWALQQSMQSGKCFDTG